MIFPNLRSSWKEIENYITKNENSLVLKKSFENSSIHRMNDSLKMFQFTQLIFSFAIVFYFMKRLIVRNFFFNGKKGQKVVPLMHFHDDKLCSRFFIMRSCVSYSILKMISKVYFWSVYQRRLFASIKRKSGKPQKTHNKTRTISVYCHRHMTIRSFCLFSSICLIVGNFENRLRRR